jgi:hypothetical protein
VSSPEIARFYLLPALEAAPVAIAKLAPCEGDPRWDKRPNPERFTLREVIAHLADWDEIFMARMNRTLSEENPFLASVDEGVLCAERLYESQPTGTNMARFAANRAQLIEMVRGFEAQDWARPAHREFVGDVDLFRLVTIVIGHDGYHIKQFADAV